MSQTATTNHTASNTGLDFGPQAAAEKRRRQVGSKIRESEALVAAGLTRSDVTDILKEMRDGMEDGDQRTALVLALAAWRTVTR